MMSKCTSVPTQKSVLREILPYSTVEAAARVEKSELLSKENVKRLSRRERECLNTSSADELERLLQEYLERAIKRREVTKDKRNKLKRATNKTSDFLVAFHGYVEAFSGVIQIMNGAPGAGGYGNAAYGALSLFLMVNNYLNRSWRMILMNVVRSLSTKRRPKSSSIQRCMIYSKRTTESRSSKKCIRQIA